MLPERIAAIGASTCHGNVDPEHGGFVGRLRQWHEAQKPTNSVFNLGVPGDTTTGILNRMNAEMKPRAPQLILVQHGINDIRREGSAEAPNAESREDFQNNLRRIIIRAQSYADVVFVGVHPINQAVTNPVYWAPHYFLSEDVRLYAQTAAEVCADMDVGYIDIFSAWSASTYDHFLDKNGIHANAAGHEMIYSLVLQHLQQRYP